MSAPEWLTARPVAHRGLHDISRGIVENMPAAAEAAIAGNFAIECDIQLTADGEAMVHHDDELGRLTEGSGTLLTKTAAELKQVRRSIGVAFQSAALFNSFSIADNVALPLREHTALAPVRLGKGFRFTFAYTVDDLETVREL